MLVRGSCRRKWVARGSTLGGGFTANFRVRSWFRCRTYTRCCYVRFNILACFSFTVLLRRVLVDGSTLRVLRLGFRVRAMCFVGFSSILLLPSCSSCFVGFSSLLSSGRTRHVRKKPTIVSAAILTQLW